MSDPDRIIEKPKLSIRSNLFIILFILIIAFIFFILTIFSNYKYNESFNPDKHNCITTCKEFDGNQNLLNKYNKNCKNNPDYCFHFKEKEISWKKVCNEDCYEILTRK